MSWSPNDLLTDLDLKSYEKDILTKFGTVDWASKRTKALEDWLWPILKTQGFAPERFRTRFNPSAAYTATASVFTDREAAVSSASEDDLNLGTALAAATDYLYLGSSVQFRGAHLRMLDSVSSTSATMTVQLWTDTWQAVAVQDGTSRTLGKPLSGGGSILWTVPSDWTVRTVNGSAALYWMRLALSNAPTNATITQAGCIRASVLRAPVTYRTLALIMREAITGQDGPWLEKATQYEADANAALQRAMPNLGGEFDTDADDQVGSVEEAQTAEEAGGGPWVLERA